MMSPFTSSGKPSGGPLGGEPLAFVEKSLENRGEANRFSRLVRSPRVFRTMVCEAWVWSVGATLLFGPLAAGRADRSLTPCQLTLIEPPRTDGRKLPATPGLSAV